ncbi:NAD(P)H azoreductase [Actinomadura rubteroloni]|uniref:NAD(P)H azoreductase n=1 Tax=Actinomadura rubteroloni TaxID=1926885 RepID=A0A2P4UGW8_9ACTN|nr:SDR family oxidoreductase [Actinomadura rubteroloni]POM24313.1 NAD(P)H azoreductase [Actinomadura rubteroloni]
MILVTGATGSIGRHLVRRLTADGTPFRALVRDPARGDDLGCAHVTGDFDLPETLPPALDGVEQMFLNAGGAVPADGEQPMVRQQKAMIDAARRAGVRRIVKVSVLGAREGGRLAQGAHWEIERHLAASGIPAAVLRPGGFMQNFRTGAGAFTADGDLLGAYGDGRVAYVDCRDIADCAAALLHDPSRTGTFVLTGPEALTHDEIAAELSRAQGRTVRYVDLPPDEFAATLTRQGLPAAFAADVAALFAEVAAGSQDTVTGTVRDLTGRPPRDFASFLAA